MAKLVKLFHSVCAIPGNETNLPEYSLHLQTAARQQVDSRTEGEHERGDPSWKIPVDQIWGWIYGHLPGRRYMKLLTCLTLAQVEYEKIEKHVKTIWSTA